MKQGIFATADQQLEDAISRAEQVRQALESCGSTQDAQNLSKLIEAAASQSFSIGLVGQAKRGKSTLINALLGRTDDVMAPVGRFPATNVISCFSHSPDENVSVVFSDDNPRKISSAEIKLYACEEFNPGNQKGVKRIEVEAPFTRLGAHAVLVDTPGADNALSAFHDTVLLEFLPHLHAVIFLISADEPLIESELELLRAIRQRDIKKIVFAINKVDRVDAEELHQAMEHNRKALGSVGLGNAPLYPVSAKNFHQSGADEGTQKLLDAVGALIQEGATKTISERLLDVANRYAVEVLDDAQGQLTLYQASEDQLRSEKQELQKLRVSLRRTSPDMERKFRNAWRVAVKGFEDVLSSVEARMINEYSDLIARAGAAKLPGLGTTIHVDVLKRLDELLQPPAETMGKALDKAVENLQVDYRVTFGASPSQAGAIGTNRGQLKHGAEIALSGVMPALGAAVCATLPGFVGTAILSTAPAIAAATLWNPFTWGPALATATANAAVTTAGAAAATVLAPLAAVGVPLLIAYTGLKVVSTWQCKVAESRNSLTLSVKELIRQLIAEARRNAAQFRDKDEDILAQFTEQMDQRLETFDRQLEGLIASRPTTEQWAGVNQAIRVLQKFKASSDLHPDAGSVPKRLLPGSDRI